MRGVLEKVAEEVVGDYARQAEARWERMTHKYMIEKAMVRPVVFLAITDNWLQFTLRYVVEYKQRRTVRDRLFSAILEEVAKNAGRISIASTTMEVTVAGSGGESSRMDKRG